MVTRRSALRAGALALVGLAGCLGSDDDAGGNTPTDTTTATGTGTPTRTRTRTQTPTSTPSIPEDAQVLDYGSLSADRRAAFDEARSGGVRFSDSLPDAEHGLDTYDFFEGYDYVRKEGTYYRLEFDDPSIVAGGVRVGVSEVEEPGDANVTDLESVSDPDVDLLREAIETGETLDEPGNHLDDRFAEGDVVEYEGGYYEITTLYHADYGAASMTAEEVD